MVSVVLQEYIHPNNGNICFTMFQRLLDASHRDLRRARAAALNIVPTSTGAAKAVSLVLPQLKGKLNGIALRVPTPNVSVVDLVINVEKKGLTAEDVNDAFRKAAAGPLKGVLDVCDTPLVSCDFRCSDVSTTIDSSLTMVMGDDMVKVVAWYDNEWGYRYKDNSFITLSNYMIYIYIFSFCLNFNVFFRKEFTSFLFFKQNSFVKCDFFN